MGAQTLAIIVTYFPDQGRLSGLVDSLRSQVDRCMVVDNGSEADVALALTGFPSDWLVVRRLGLNLGIASAQNVGIEYAKEHGFGYVVLFDQDSVPAQDMIELLLQAHGRLTSAGVKVAAVGPRFFSVEIGGVSPFVRSRWGWPRRVTCPDADAVVQSDHLIASGCLMSLTSLAAIGTMNEALFIDSVDIEWGLRAKAHGYLCFGVCASTMTHSLGDGRIWVFGHGVPVRPPLRHYYMVRNGLWLAGRSWLPWDWKCLMLLRCAQYFVVYSLFAKPALSHLRMMSLGVLHALTGRLGRYDV